MRVIKFRGKRIDNGEWVYGGYHTDGRDHFIAVKRDGLFHVQLFQVHPETVGQFTGLMDKDGADIYEGDVLHLKDPLNDVEDRVSVGFRQGAFVFSEEGNCLSDEIGDDGDILDYYRVIGNIHDEG